ncbi:MAG: TonB-dependent receptor family protein, partial [Cyclobacteriaceae bacterium]|nr:TonB-dependent receptor family protein [Cyclobacteriaceae bacterium]
DLNNGERPGYEINERITTKNHTTYFTRSEGDESRKRHFWVLRGGLGYSITEKDFFNFEFNYGYSKYERTSNQDYEEGIEPGGSLNEYTSYQLGKRGGNFYSLNSSFQHDFEGKGHNIVAQVQYRNREGEESSINQLLDMDDEIASGQLSIENGPGAVLQLNLDYTHPIGENNKFETGYQSRIGRSKDKTELLWYNPDNGDYELQPEFSNDTDYSRDIHSLYGIYGGEKGKLGYQFGLRGEYTYRVINSDAIDEEFVMDRFDYFPSFHTAYKLPAEQQIMASYSRRIERPRSYYLEPFITWSDA